MDETIDADGSKTIDKDGKDRGVEVLSYWSQEYGAKIVFGAHAIHFLDVDFLYP